LLGSLSNPTGPQAISAIRWIAGSGSIVNNEVGKMIEVMSWKPVAVFTVLDREGQPIGEVVQPRTPPVVGRGAGTVLLVRDGGGEYGQLDQQ
jgi:hypothetical protein